MASAPLYAPIDNCTSAHLPCPQAYLPCPNFTTATAPKFPPHPLGRLGGCNWGGGGGASLTAETIVNPGLCPPPCPSFAMMAWACRWSWPLWTTGLRGWISTRPGQVPPGPRVLLHHTAVMIKQLYKDTAKALTSNQHHQWGQAWPGPQHHCGGSHQ